MKCIVDIPDNLYEMLNFGHPEIDDAMELWNVVKETHRDFTQYNNCISRDDVKRMLDICWVRHIYPTAGMIDDIPWEDYSNT